MIPELDEMFDLAWRQFWQVTVVAAVACALMRWACRGRPHLAYLLGLVVLAKCWTPPIWSSYGGVFCWPPTLSVSAPNVERGGEPPRDRPSIAAAGADGPQRDVESDLPALSPTPLPESPVAPAHGSFAAVAVFTAWLLGAIGFLATASAQWWRWRRGLRPVMTTPNVPLQPLVKEMAARIGLRSAPRIFVTQSSGPAVFGLLRPTIVIPERLLVDPPDNLEMVLAHEILHLRRGDLYLSLFQFATQLAWWFHPLIWWTCRQLTRERERSCDEAVLAVLRCDPPAYAQCLLNVLRWKRETPALTPFPTIRALDVTQRRLEHILQLDGAARSRTPLPYLLFAAAALCAVLPGERLAVVISQAAAPPDGVAGDTTAGPSADAQPSTDETVRREKKKDEGDKTSSKDPVANDDNPPPPAADKNPPASKIDEAVDRGIRYLKTEQYADGHWADPVGYPGGITGICTLTLLKWGMKPDEHTAQTALAWLRKIKPSMTYSTALQTLVFCAANDPADLKIVDRNAKWLAANQKTNGPMRGAWGYPVAEGDGSNTSFAVWALYEAEMAGVKVGQPVWKRNLNYWINAQNADGSWGYKPQLNGTGSMTSQGLFCVAAAAKVLGEDKPDQPAAKAIEKASTWLARNFSAHMNPGSHGQQAWLLYYLLACGKAGRLSDTAKFGEHDWYAEGSQVLLDAQQQNGSWKGTGHAEDDPHLATSLAVLFLLQGR